MPARSKALGYSILIAAALLLGSWIALSLLPENRSEATIDTGGRPQAVPVVVTPVVVEPEQLKLDAVGTSRAIRSVAIHAAAAGEVVGVHFDAGDRVKEGDLLVELDARDEKLALELAQLRIADAQRLVDRYSRAEGTDAIPPTDVDAARHALATAIVERDRAQVALDDRYVRAPFDGAVGMTDIDAGDRVDPATEITTLDDRSALLVSFEMPELLLSEVAPGQPVEVSTWNQASDLVQGEVVDLGSRIDPVTRTVVARARVPNPGDRLRPGMSFRIHLRVEGRRWPVVPEVSVQWGAEGAYVWVVTDGKAQRVGADIVQRRQGRVLVDAPLQAGDPVVLEGVQNMRAGRDVKVVEEVTHEAS